MDENTNKPGLYRRIENVDKQVPSPGERAQFLYARINATEPTPTVWDLTCLASELLAMTALIEPTFKPVAQQVSALVYEAHYIHSENLESCISKTSQQDPNIQRVLTGPNDPSK